MWTPTQIKKQRPCHFVPLLKVVRKDIHKKHMYVKIYIQQILMICLTFIFAVVSNFWHLQNL